MTEPTPSPRISIVIPVYNEEAIRSAITDLRERLSPLSAGTTRIILAENGSKDKTASFAQSLCESTPSCARSAWTGPTTAPRCVPASARHAANSCCVTRSTCVTPTSTKLPCRSSESGATDLVIGSEVDRGRTRSARPMVRHLASIAYTTGLLRGLLGFRGADAWPEGVSALGALAAWSRPASRIGTCLRARVCDPRSYRSGSASWRSRSASSRSGPLDQPVQACSQRPDQPGQAHLGDPGARLNFSCGFVGPVARSFGNAG